jgi:CO/xanthine dehydrogenase FAD-binding subunit
VEFVQPTNLADALALRAEHPGAVPIQGGTDVMVELNFHRRSPEVLLDLSQVAELRDWSIADDGRVRLGAGVTYARVIDELADRLPGLAIASRTVGSRQIRNAGTVGGNLGTASPAGDAHPPLLAARADVEVASASGTRFITIDDFFVGPRRATVAPDELIVAVHVAPASGPQQFSKVGTRTAMVIAVCSFALAIDRDRRRVGTGIGSAGPTPLRAVEAERFLAAELDACDWELPGAVDGTACRHFGTLAATAAAPIDDVRGSAAYRRHAIAVMARRALEWSLPNVASGTGG